MKIFIDKNNFNELLNSEIKLRKIIEKEREESPYIYYYGKTCPYSKHANHLINELTTIHPNILILPKEIYNNKTNQLEWSRNALNKCRGVPFFYNKKDPNNYICGVPKSTDILYQWISSNSS